MSCPYFYPVEPLSRDGDPHSALLPLGDLWAGLCRAVPGESSPPEDGTVRSLCHLGYARGACARFPAADPGADAVRFVLSRDEGACLRVSYVLERDHHPFASGHLTYSCTAGGFTEPPPGEIIQRQAGAYVASYLKWKERAS